MVSDAPGAQSSGHLLPEVSTISPPSLSHARVQLDMRWTFQLSPQFRFRDASQA